MNREFKKTFFMSLMAVLLVVSNLIGMKYTNFLDITIGVDFITYPFTFLCTLMIINLGDKKDAYRSILVASVIQLLITISYTIAINLGNQALIPDSASYVNHLFKVDQMNILGSVLAFMVSHCVLIYIYESFKMYKKELYGLVIGLLGSMVLNSVIFLIIYLRDYEAIYIINMLLSNIIIDILLIAVILVIFYILKEKDTQVIIKNIKTDNKDISLEEVINDKTSVKVIKKSNPKTKKTVVRKNNANSNTRKKVASNNTTKKNVNKKSTNTTKK